MLSALCCVAFLFDWPSFTLAGVMVEDWFGLPLPMEGVKSTSLVYNVVQEVRTEPFACFCDEDSNHCHLELYPRPNGK